MDFDRIIALFTKRGERFALLKASQPNNMLEQYPMDYPMDYPYNEINWIWTGFQLINRTHFANDDNQFLQGHFLYSQSISSHGKVKGFRLKFCRESVTLRGFWQCCFLTAEFQIGPPRLIMLFHMILDLPSTRPNSV